MAGKVNPKKVALKKPVVRRSSKAASKKPIFGMGTLITLVVFAGIVLFGIILNRQKETAAAEATPVESKDVAYLFTTSDGTLSSIEVKPNEGQTVKLARDDKNTWAFELPEKAEADQGLAEAAASQVSALQIIGTLPEDADPVIFGFDKTAYVITLKFGEGKARALEVGSATPTNSGYYVRVDKGRIKIVDLSGIDALTQLVDSPPYLYTPTPVPTLTNTAIPPTVTATLPAPTGETTTPAAGKTPTGATPTPEASVTSTP
jgi:cell division septation protein DedD